MGWVGEQSHSDGTLLGSTVHMPHLSCENSGLLEPDAEPGCEAQPDFGEATYMCPTRHVNQLHTTTQ